MPNVDALRAKITPIPPEPPIYSLLISARAAGLVDEALYHGWTFYPEMCAGAVGGIKALEDDGSTAAMTAVVEAVDDPTENIAGDPFVIWYGEVASAMDLGRDWAGRVERGLAAVESYWLAHELALGSLGLTQRALNANSGTTTVTSGAQPSAVALALLERGIGNGRHGARYQVHAAPDAFDLLKSDGVIDRDGTVWKTPMGMTVIVDAGYTGSGPGDTNDPSAGSSFIYATSPIRVQVSSDVKANKVDTPENRAQVTDRSTNTVTIYAAKIATWVWDECSHYAAEVDTTSTHGN